MQVTTRRRDADEPLFDLTPLAVYWTYTAAATIAALALAGPLTALGLFAVASVSFLCGAEAAHDTDAPEVEA